MKFIKRTLICLVAGLLLLEAYQLTTDETTFTSAFANAIFNNNLHEVVQGKLFRSAEMSADDIQRVVRENQIKTVLDLRITPRPIPKGSAPEQSLMEKSGVNYVHFPLLGSQEMAPEQVKELLAEIDKIQPPLLIHCSSGTHRSGVVSAIWMMENGVPFEIASQQLSAKYGFFMAERKLKSLVDGHPTIDNILWRYQKAREEKPVTFHEWVDAGMPD